MDVACVCYRLIRVLGIQLAVCSGFSSFFFRRSARGEKRIKIREHRDQQRRRRDRLVVFFQFELQQLSVEGANKEGKDRLQAKTNENNEEKEQLKYGKRGEEGIGEQTDHDDDAADEVQIAVKCGGFNASTVISARSRAAVIVDALEIGDADENAGKKEEKTR
jgi:hypothetical protein